MLTSWKLAPLFAIATPIFGDSELARTITAREQTACGPSEGSCPEGFCCSTTGFCGTSVDFCGGSQCQLEYSHTCGTLQPPAGSDTLGSSSSRPCIGNVPCGGPMITTCTEPGMVALTFDDGPYTYTNDLLNLLDHLDTKATFFITGNNRGKTPIDNPSAEWPGILRRMNDAGHQIASHTWTHRDLNQATETDRRAEIVNNEMAMRNIFGWIPTYFRPPYLECNAGSGCENTLGDLAYHSISTNLDTKDYMFDDPNLIQQSKDRFSNGLPLDPHTGSYIVLAHDVHEQTVHGLTLFMVNLAKERGYKLVTVGECLGDPKQNWYRSADMFR